MKEAFVSRKTRHSKSVPALTQNHKRNGPVLPENSIERINGQAGSFDIREAHSFSVASPNVEVDVNFRVWDR